MPQDSSISHTIFFDTQEEKEMFQRWLWHLKYKTGETHGRIVNQAMMEYNMLLDERYAKPKKEGLNGD